MNEQSIMDDIGYEVHLNDIGDENKYNMQQVGSLTTATNLFNSLKNPATVPILMEIFMQKK